jgi:hypothetical protein
MNDFEVQSALAETRGLNQWQRVSNIYSAPSKTFEDIKRGNRSWWLPLLITLLSFAVFYAVVSTKVTWTQVYENEQRNIPEFFKQMQERQPPEAKAAAAKNGPIGQAVSVALSPVGVVIMDVIAAALLLATINFGFGGKATFGSLFAVTLYAGLVMWPLKWLLGALASFFVDPESFNIQNYAPTNVGAFLSRQEMPLSLYALVSSLDVTAIWCMVVTGIGVATVAGVKRNSGYIAVFGWWIVGILIGVGFATIVS